MHHARRHQGRGIKEAPHREKMTWTREDERAARYADAALETLAFPRVVRSLGLRVQRRTDGVCVGACEAYDPEGVPPFTQRFLAEVAEEHAGARVLGVVFDAGHYGDLEPGDAVYVYDAGTLAAHVVGRVARVFFRARDNRTAWVVVG